DCQLARLSATDASRVSAPRPAAESDRTRARYCRPSTDGASLAESARNVLSARATAGLRGEQNEARDQVAQGVLVRRVSHSISPVCESRQARTWRTSSW